MSDTKTKLTRSKFVPQPGQDVPPGAQNITFSSCNNSVAIYGDGPFEIWFLYEGSQTASFTFAVDNNGFQPMSPGIPVNLSAQDSILFDWQGVNPSQPIKLVWIFLSGCSPD